MIETSVLYSLLFCILILALARKWNRSNLPYPPGPKGYPILGNVFDLPMNVPIWENITSLSNRHGTDVLYLQLLGEGIVVLSSNEAITDLIEKRSSIYSDRPQTPMMKLTGTTEWSLAVMSYGARWRVRRRLCQEVLNARLTGSFDDHQYKYVHRLLSRLLEEPKNFIQEVEFTPGAIALSITYGIDVESFDDPFLNANIEAAHATTAVTVPGKFLVDIVPILQYIPDWFPGTGFKALAKEARDKFKISTNGPLEYVKSALKSGKGFSHSITSDCLSRLEGGEQIAFDEEVIRDVSGVMFAAAAETTRSSLKALFLAMVLNPEVMKKAQEELDRVVGKGHLPSFSDRENLPYISAVVKELLRWSPPAPISVPNRVMQDDVYRGYFIPAGATVIQNVWAIFRDPNIYPDPEAFNPDRFLKDGKINPLVFDPEDRVFGAGRRICPGRHLALRTVYLVVACVLSVFDIGPALDESGNPQAPNVQYDSSLVRSLEPFKCTIKPRSDDTVKLVKEACDRTSH